MPLPPTHVVASSGRGAATWTDASLAGPVLSDGAAVAVLAVVDGSAHVELDDGSQVWVDAGELRSLADGVDATQAMPTAGPPAALDATQPMATAPNGTPPPPPRPPPMPAPGSTLEIGRDPERHPPPPLPGADAPVKLAGLRVTTQLLGGALVLAATLLPWTSQFFTTSRSAFGIPLKALLDPAPDGAPAGFIRLAFFLVPLGAAILLTGLRILPPPVGQAAGGAAALIALVFVAQLQRSMGKFYAATVFGVLGIGPYLTMLGGLVSAVARGDQRTQT